MICYFSEIMESDNVNKYLITFTFTGASIALIILISMILKHKFCLRKVPHSKHSHRRAVPQHQNEFDEISHDTPNKVLIRFFTFFFFLLSSSTAVS